MRPKELSTQPPLLRCWWGERNSEENRRGPVPAPQDALCLVPFCPLTQGVAQQGVSFSKCARIIEDQLTQLTSVHLISHCSFECSLHVSENICYLWNFLTIMFDCKFPKLVFSAFPYFRIFVLSLNFPCEGSPRPTHTPFSMWIS